MSRWAIAVEQIDDQGIGHDVVIIEESTWTLALATLRVQLMEMMACNCPHDYPNGYGVGGAHNAFCASVRFA